LSGLQPQRDCVYFGPEGGRILTGYSEIDDQLLEWARRHRLYFPYHHEFRDAYVSSEAGDCFQMWIEIPVGGYTVIHAAFVDGPVERECNADWTVSTVSIGSSLDELFTLVESWMKPSKRYFPPNPKS
jgi:hypothetical protein